jgi:hypothetical protein
VPPIRVWVLRDPRPLREYNFDYYGAGRRKRWLHSPSLISAVSCLLLATLSPSDGRACSFSIQRAPQIKLKRWPLCYWHILYDGLPASKVRYG